LNRLGPSTATIANREQQARKRHQDVDGAAQDLVHAAAEVARGRSHRNPHGRGNRHDHEADEDRNPGPGEHPRQDVAPELVEAEPVLR
jgi:hypothetical protein